MTERFDDFEMADGSRPEVVPLSADLARTRPLDALFVLTTGDVFEVVQGRPPADGPRRAQAYFQSKITLVPHGASAAHQERVRRDICKQVGGNPQLLARLEASRPVTIDLIPPGHPLWKYGYPRGVSPNASGLFWDHPDWERARIALKQEQLDEEPALVVHEMGHAIHALALTEEERDTIYQRLLPAFRSKRAIDEVFAIYSEREFLDSFSDDDLRAPGIYGFARARWSENHLFTRFVRLLYFPYKRLAGPPSLGGF